MSYQVIARKWRPQTFEEVTGQEHITRTLRNAVEHERLHHAYLFSGARGVGKTTTARLLAKAVNCHRSDRPTPTPCRTTDPDACASCREVAEGRSIDVMEIDAASHTQVDNIREVVINSVGIAPARDRYKIFIIDEVHMLSGHSFNALLKTIEEPPPRVLFIMATTHPHKVPETILSRSQQFEFRTISAQKITERLRLIADAEKIKVSDEALREIARAGEGSMRDAQSAFDQVISFSEGKIETSDVEAALGIAGRELLSRVMRAVAEQRAAEALAVVEELTARGHELRNFCRDLLAHLRDLLVVKVAGDSAMPDATEAERRELLEEARDFSESDLVRFFHSMTETETRLGAGGHPRYQLEVGLVKLVEMRRLAPLGQIVERLNALEESLRTGRAPAAGGTGSQTPPATVPPTSSAPPRRGMAGGGGGASSLSQADSFSQADASASAALSNAAPAPNIPAAKAEGVEGAGAHASPHVNARVQSQASPVHASDKSAPDRPAPDKPAPDRPAPDRPKPNRPALDRDADVDARPAATTNLKLVPPPLQSGGVPSFAGDAAKRAADAPFALADGASAGAGLFDAPRPFVEAEAPRPFIEVEASRPFVEGARAGEDRVGQPVSLVTAKHPSTHATHAAASAQAPAADASNARNEPDEPAYVGRDDPASLFKRKLEERGKPLLAAALDGARHVLVEDEEVRVEFTPERKHLHDTLRKPENMRLLREVCCEVLGRSVGVAVRVRVPGELEDEQGTAEDGARREQRALRERAEGHPVVQTMLKTFRAEIVDVRRTDKDVRRTDSSAQPQ
ncbi:MAG: polymerase subunit gamma/tau [Acidobacteriota bacterium]|jgi:DNA polymerase-3 subunit gamma/tau|nr:polymerase subunit gamma/tau [Acidobacteriota bacterium]